MTKRVVYSGRIFSIVLEEKELESGEVLVLESVEAPDVVRVYPIRDGSLWLIREFRYELGHEVIRTVSGRINPGESPEQAALRELREELGGVGLSPVVFATSRPILKVSSTVHHVIVSLETFHQPQLEVGERIRAEEIPLRDVEELVWDGKIAEDVIALQLVRLARQPSLGF